MDHFSDIGDRDTREWLEPDMEDDFRDFAYRDELYVPRRLRHQVLVDGRLVDSWTEPVEGTRWERHARDFDPGTSAITRLPRPLHAAIRSRRCSTGSRGWSVAGIDSTSSTTSPWRCRRGRCSRIRRTVPSSKPWSAFSTRWPRSSSETMPDQHSVRPCCTCGTTVPTSSCAQSRPRTQPAVSAGPSHAPTAGFPPHTNVRQKEVQRHLWLTSTISAVGGPVVRALRDLGPRPGPCPTDYPDLLALGHPDLLTATTLLQVIGWRDKATAARDAYGPPPADGATTTTGGRLS